MTNTVTIEVYCNDGEVFGVAKDHSPDLPKPFDVQLQEWVKSTFSDLEKGDKIQEAGKMVYEPDGDIIEFVATK